MRTVPIEFDNSIPLVDIMTAIASIDCTLRAERGRLVIQRNRKDSEPTSNNVVQLDCFGGRNE